MKIMRPPVLIPVAIVGGLALVGGGILVTGKLAGSEAHGVAKAAGHKARHHAPSTQAAVANTIPPTTQPVGPPSPVSTAATLNSTCTVGFTPTGQGAVFAPGPPKDQVINGTTYPAIPSYQLVLNNNSGSTADINGFAVVFYDSSGTELGSDKENVSEAFLTTGHGNLRAAVSPEPRADLDDRRGCRRPVPAMNVREWRLAPSFPARSMRLAAGIPRDEIIKIVARGEVRDPQTRLKLKISARWPHKARRPGTRLTQSLPRQPGRTPPGTVELRPPGAKAGLLLPPQAEKTASGRRLSPPDEDREGSGLNRGSRGFESVSV